jgi:methyl-accepting chemotaxis protein
MKFTLGRKLGLGFAVILALMVVSAGLSYRKASEIKEIEHYVLSNRVPAIRAVAQIQDDLDYSGSKTRQVILAATEPGRFSDAQRRFDAAWDRIDKSVEKVTQMSAGWQLQENKDRAAELKRNMPQIRAAQEAAINTAKSGARDAVVTAGNEYADKVTPLIDANAKIAADLAAKLGETLADYQAQLDAGNSSLAWTMVLTTLCAIGFGIFVAVYLSRAISKATGAALGNAEAIADGDLTSADIVIASRDELGDLAKALNRMQNKLREVIESISRNAQQVAAASEEFSATSQQISANSEETSAQANVVSVATDEVNRNLQTVAASTEEMSASISEIAKNAGEAARVAGEAMRAASQTDATVTKLGESSAEIGQVIKVITSIAQQTNLLALNATIEAARAGEAGKGFAVVANEVKGLAKQTAKATEDISLRIAAIQADAKSAVDAIKSISTIIGQVNDISATIATAVEEQSATTSEMSRNVSEAAKGSGQVSKNIGGVAQAAQSTSASATDSQKAAKDLALMSTELRTLVGQFRIDSNGQKNAHAHRGSVS